MICSICGSETDDCLHVKYHRGTKVFANGQFLGTVEKWEPDPAHWNVAKNEIEKENLKIVRSRYEFISRRM